MFKYFLLMALVEVQFQVFISPVQVLVHTGNQSKLDYTF
jgi:hypothetical protein